MNRKQIINALRALGITFDGQSSTAVLNGLLRDTWLTVTVRNEAKSGTDYDFEMNINGPIGMTFFGDDGYSAKQFQDELKPFSGRKGLLNIHSPGGNVWDGFAIAEMIRAHGNIDTKVLGVAASAADVIFQAGQNRIMPKTSQRMGHCTSGYLEIAGNAKELQAARPEYDKLIARLEKHDATLAKMYADRSGQSLDQVKADMDAEEFMDGDESLEKGYCDELTEEFPDTDVIPADRLSKFPQAILNHFSAPTQGAAKTNHQPKPKDTIVNLQQKIALLRNQWGLTIPDNVTEARCDELINLGKEKATQALSNKVTIGRDQNVALLNAWGVAFAATATDSELENLVAKGKPTAAPANNNPPNVLNLDDHPVVKQLKKQAEDQRRNVLRNELEKIASVEGGERIPVNQIDDWLNDAMAATDDVKGNPVINKLRALEPKDGPGVAPIAKIEFGTDGKQSIPQLEKAVSNLLKSSDYLNRNGVRNPDNNMRRDLAANSKQVSRLINALKQFDGKGLLIGPLRDAWDSWAAGVQNANAMSASLLRQVILSEIMRAFRREFATLSLFSHNYKDVALQGTDKVEVPYYPLDTTASTEYTQAAGYVMGANAQTSNKEVFVGGKGDGVASSGSGRKYKPLQFSAYEIARQPYLNIAQLIVLAAEQLAIDIRADILGTHVKAANFGNAIWQGASGAFDKSVFTNFLLNAAIKAFWPQAGRNCVLTPDFYTNLLGDPGLQRVNEAGDDAALRQGIIGRLLSFNEVTYDALLPVANFIRGGDGNVTAGPDANLAGFICFPSAILIATAPIMPGPATMKLLASYEQVTDDQTGLTFSYQYFGNVLGSNDNEIIECSYGSGLGELAALKRIVTAGV